jgi:phospholipid N-methyltransferase
MLTVIITYALLSRGVPGLRLMEVLCNTDFYHHKGKERNACRTFFKANLMAMSEFK